MDTSEPTTVTTMDELQKEMASLIRVRNRLAQSSDTALPKILTGLLPRLVEHLDRHSAALQQLRNNNRNASLTEEERALRTKLQGHVSGIWMHAIERIRGGLHTIPPGAPWVPSLLSLLQQQSWTDLTVAFVLSLLQASLPRYTIPPPPTTTQTSLSSREAKAWQQLQFLSTLPALGALVDRLHQSLVMTISAREPQPLRTTTTTSNNNTDNLLMQSRDLNYRSAGWLCWDVLALSWGLPVLVDWDKDHFDEYEWTTPTPLSLADQAELLTSTYTDNNVTCSDMLAVVATVPWLANPGMFHLALDLLLFWPDDPRHQQHAHRIRHEAELAVIDHDMGISAAGIARLNHRCRRAAPHQSWNVRYLRELKLACVNHIVEPLRTKQLCDDTERCHVIRALLHCILTASTTSMHGKLMLEFLNKSQFYFSNESNNKNAAITSSAGKSNASKRAAATSLSHHQSPVAYTVSDSKPTNCPYDLTFVSCLLALVLGDRVSSPILNKFGTEMSKIKAILGPIPNTKGQSDEAMDGDETAVDLPPAPAARRQAVQAVANGQNHDRAAPEQSQPSYFQRSPMPFGVAERAVEFVVSRLLPQKSTGRPEGFVDLKNTAGGHIILSSGANDQEEREALGLFVELVLALKDQKGKLGAYWAMQLLDGIYSQLSSPAKMIATRNFSNSMDVEGDEEATMPDEWITSFHMSSLEISKTVLSQIAQVDAEGNAHLGEMQLQQNPVPHALGVPGPFGMRRDLNQLLADHRGSQRKRQLRVDCALQARRTAYRIVTDLAPRIVSYNHMDPSLFDFPKILLKCAVGEDDAGMHPFVTKAMDRLLDVFKDSFNDHNPISEAQVAPLLPSLLSAVCADSSLARLCAAKWAVEFIRDIDPPVSDHICTFLADDVDPFVAAVAKKGLQKMSYSNVAMEDVSRECPVSLLDLENDGEKAAIQADLDEQVEEFSAAMNLPKSAAGVVLGDFGFDAVKAQIALKDHRSKTLAHSGVIVRCGGVVSMSDSDDNPGAGHFCEICYDEVGMDDIYQLPCEHKFCRPCWDEFLNNSLQAWPVASRKMLSISCPQQKCPERVTKQDIQEVASHLAFRWDDIVLRSFVNNNKCYSKCPGPDCTMVAHSDEKRGTTPTHCSQCKSSFCFSCGNPPHQPAHCTDFAEWRKIFSSSDFWVKKNAKPCPGCNIPIEKNDGCNHMQCSQCSYHFCWLCLGPLRSHMEPHICNRYEPHEGAENERERRSLFFSDRVEAHERSALYAKTQAEAFIVKREKFASETLWFVSDEDLDLRETAARTLVQARQFLKNSYVAAWAMKDASDFPIRDIFEGYQANLELFTEKLSQLLLTAKLHNLYSEEGSRAIRMHFRAVSFSTASIMKYMGRILSLLEQEPKGGA